MSVLFLLCMVDSMTLNGHAFAAQLLNCRYNIFLVLLTLSKTHLVFDYDCVTRAVKSVSYDLM